MVVDVMMGEFRNRFEKTKEQTSWSRSENTKFKRANGVISPYVLYMILSTFL
jgi:hypothetical protein